MFAKARSVMNEETIAAAKDMVGKANNFQELDAAIAAIWSSEPERSDAIKGTIKNVTYVCEATEFGWPTLFTDTEMCNLFAMENNEDRLAHVEGKFGIRAKTEELMNKEMEVMRSMQLFRVRESDKQVGDEHDACYEEANRI